MQIVCRFSISCLFFKHFSRFDSRFFILTTVLLFAESFFFSSSELLCTYIYLFIFLFSSSLPFLFCSPLCQFAAQQDTQQALPAVFPGRRSCYRLGSRIPPSIDCRLFFSNGALNWLKKDFIFFSFFFYYSSGSFFFYIFSFATLLFVRVFIHTQRETPTPIPTPTYQS